jgi:hypothetical protein
MILLDFFGLKWWEIVRLHCGFNALKLVVCRKGRLDRLGIS